jgi:glycosyltransferase involved in cell wall biosynthesis
MAIRRLTKGLIHNWVEADATIATYCFTAFAGYELMDRTVPFYHMQHYEELFFTGVEDRMLARSTYFLPLSLMANSSWLKTQIKERFKRDAFLLTPAISHEIFYPRAMIAEKYSSPKKIRIVSYADARAFKGWEDGVAAMEIVFSKLGKKNIEWVVFGGYQPRTDLPIQHVGKIFNDDLAALYSSAHIVFMPSWYESYPRPPLEAMNCGTAAVCTQFGTEDYAYDKQNALVVPPRNPRALAEAIIALATDPKLAKELALNGLETAREITWEKSTDRLEEILKRGVSEYKFRDSFADVDELAKGILND